MGGGENSILHGRKETRHRLCTLPSQVLGLHKSRIFLIVTMTLALCALLTTNESSAADKGRVGESEPA